MFRSISRFNVKAVDSYKSLFVPGRSIFVGQIRPLVIWTRGDLSTIEIVHTFIIYFRVLLVRIRLDLRSFSASRNDSSRGCAPLKAWKSSGRGHGDFRAK